MGAAASCTLRAISRGLLGLCLETDVGYKAHPSLIPFFLPWEGVSRAPFHVPPYPQADSRHVIPGEISSRKEARGLGVSILAAAFSPPLTEHLGTLSATS